MQTDGAGSLRDVSVKGSKKMVFVNMVGPENLITIKITFISNHLNHEHSDHNIRTACLHFNADALTSVPAILGLTAGMILGYPVFKYHCSIGKFTGNYWQLLNGRSDY